MRSNFTGNDSFENKFIYQPDYNSITKLIDTNINISDSKLVILILLNLLME